MPIYEFYCEDCHTIYQFWSSRVNTEKIPACPNPDCGRPALERRLSPFSINRGLREEDAQAEDPLAGVDEQRLMRAMASLEERMEGLDEDDPRQAAQAMRLLYREAGLPMTPTVEEAVSRLEAGEDPDQVEQELGQALDEEDLFGANKGKGRLRKLRNRLLPPRVDDKLYRL
ncbi:MAG TPA: zinc ribbon domain-containing protein [Chromatiales bacterium]|nr:zinc ribbon domain-containing protein [Chromatiales bacterium]